MIKSSETIYSFVLDVKDLRLIFNEAKESKFEHLDSILAEIQDYGTYDSSVSFFAPYLTALIDESYTQAGIHYIKGSDVFFHNKQEGTVYLYMDLSYPHTKLQENHCFISECYIALFEDEDHYGYVLDTINKRISNNRLASKLLDQIDSCLTLYPN